MTLQELFSEPAKWARGYYARDARGGATDHDSPYAVCWCLLGGIRKCYPKQTIQKANELHAVTMKRYQKGVADFNDDVRTTFDEVRGVLAEANL